MIDIEKYTGHLANEGQTWRKSKWMLKNAKTIEQHKATSALLEDAPLLLEEVKRLREELDRVEKECGALWSITDCWSMCMDDYSMHDQYEDLDERYAHADWGIILKELYTYTEEDGWQPKEMIE